MIEVVLLGAGNVATHLFRAFKASGKVKVKQVYNHSAASLEIFEKETPTTTSLNDLVEADIYLLALKDDVISKTTAQLAHKKGLVVHTSGSVALEDVKHERRGVFYPLQTFSKDKKVAYSSIPFCLEAGSEHDLELLKQLAGAVSGNFFEIDSKQRRKLHLAAVFVCNFVNQMYAIGEKICSDNNIPFEILRPLIHETAEKVMHASPSEVQTGPAMRNDQSTINAHLQLLDSGENKEIYQLITTAIQSFHGKKL